MTEQKRPANAITEGVIWKQLMIFFFPILLGTFFQQLYNTADAMIVGRFVGKEALSAVGGTTSTIINLIIGFFVGLASGATVIISQFYGARQRENVSRAVHTAIALAIAGGALLTVVGIAVAPWALRLLNTPEEVMGHAQTYMRIYFAGTIGNLIFNIGSGILRAIGDSKRPLYVLIACTCANIVLDLFLFWSFPWASQAPALRRSSASSSAPCSFYGCWPARVKTCGCMSNASSCTPTCWPGFSASACPPGCNRSFIRCPTWSSNQASTRSAPTSWQAGRSTARSTACSG